MLADVFHSAVSQTLAIVAGTVICATPVALFRWMRKHVAKPLKQVPVIQARLESVDKKVTNLGERFTPVEEQFFMNHGTTLRDQGNRTEKLARATASAVGVDPDEIAPPDA